MADQKITQLNALTTLTDDDLVVIVQDPGGTPETMKMTVANLKIGLGFITKARVRAYKTTSTGFGSSYAKIVFDAESFDVGSNFASGTFTAPRTGQYSISANARGTSGGSSTARGIGIAIYKNGTLYSQSASAKTGSTGGICGANISDILSLTAGDTVEIYGITDATAEFTAGAGEDDTFICINEL
jgi:hypothetical protein